MSAAVADDGHDEGTANGSQDVAASPFEAGTSDHDGGDDAEFEADSGGGATGGEFGELVDSGDADEDSREGVEEDFESGDIDSTEACGGFIGADGVEVPAEDGPAEDGSDGDGEEQGDEDSRGNTNREAYEGKLEIAGETNPAIEFGEPVRDFVEGWSDGGFSGEDLGDAEGDGHGSQGDDERNDSEPTDENAVGRANRSPAEDRGGNRDQRRSTSFKPMSEDRGAQSDGRSGGKIDSPGDDDQGHTESGDDDRCGLNGDRLQISRGEKGAVFSIPGGIGQGKKRKDQCQSDEGAQVKREMGTSTGVEGGGKIRGGGHGKLGCGNRG